MAATDSLTSVAFPADMTAPGCWDPQVPAVPYSSAMTLPDTDNIIAELSMFESAISTPIPSDTTALPLTPPPKRPAPAASTSSYPPSKKLKTSPSFTAPPPTSSPASLASYPTYSPQQTKPEVSLFVSSPLTSPVSPTGSLCSDEAVDDCAPPPPRHHHHHHHHHPQHSTSHCTPPLSPSSSPSPCSLSPPPSQHNPPQQHQPTHSAPVPAPPPTHSRTPTAQAVKSHAQQHGTVAQHSSHRPPTSPLPADLSALPALTREHTKRRRSLRRAALNRARDRRSMVHCMSAAAASSVKSEPCALGSPGSSSLSCSRMSMGSAPSSPRRSSGGLSVDGVAGGCSRGNLDVGPGSSSASLGGGSACGFGRGNGGGNGVGDGTTGCGGGHGMCGKREAELAGAMMGSGEHVDKKAARAIRNREAAMKSRIEAKQKMRKLQDENDSLAVKVKSLNQENETLTTQLKNLLSTFGVNVSDGQDMKSVLAMLARMGSGNRGTVGAQGV